MSRMLAAATSTAILLGACADGEKIAITDCQSGKVSSGCGGWTTEMYPDQDGEIINLQLEGRPLAIFAAATSILETVDRSLDTYAAGVDSDGNIITFGYEGAGFGTVASPKKPKMMGVIDVEQVEKLDTLTSQAPLDGLTIIDIVGQPAIDGMYPSSGIIIANGEISLNGAVSISVAGLDAIVVQITAVE